MFHSNHNLAKAKYICSRFALLAAVAFVSGNFSLSGASAADSNKVELHSAGAAKSDTDYQYLSGKATSYYKRGNYNRAAQLFSDAVNVAQNQGVKDDRMALLLTNLASAYREQQRYGEAEPLFSRAVEIERKQPVKDSRAINYTAQQYAALLRDTDRDVSSDFILAAASNNFASMKGGELEKEATSGEQRLNDETTIARGEAQSGLFSEDRGQSKSSPSIFSNRSTFGATPSLAVTAQLRELAEIERLYSEQTPLSGFGNPYGGLNLPNYGSFYTPLVSTYSYFPVGGSGSFGGFGFRGGHYSSFGGGRGFGGGHR